MIMIAAIIVACGSKKAEGNASSNIDPKKIYKLNCQLCHGSDGKLGANGSKDLTVSPLGLDERISIITNGKGAMAAYSGILSTEEIKAVAAYTLELK